MSFNDLVSETIKQMVRDHIGTPVVKDMILDAIKAEVCIENEAYEAVKLAVDAIQVNDAVRDAIDHRIESMSDEMEDEIMARIDARVETLIEETISELPMLQIVKRAMEDKLTEALKNLQL
jgi:thiazole synthase ThiGH ThiG subunit